MRIEENNKAQFTKEIETLLRKTRACQDIELTYGSVEYIPLKTWEKGAIINKCYNSETEEYEERLFKIVFTPSERNLERREDGREIVQIKIDGETIYQSVESSSYWGMILDITKRLDKERI